MTMRYRFTLTERDFIRLMNGEELIAEEDTLKPYRAIKVRWAWTKEEMGENAQAKRY